MRKFLPYVFLGLLAIILFFVIGVRYGQKVEKANKTISYLISIAPTPTALPRPTEAPLAFEPYRHSGCGVDFPRPLTFKIEKTSTDEAVFTENGKTVMSFACPKNLAAPKAAPSPACLTIDTQRLACTRENGTVSFTAYNPVNGKRILFHAGENLIPFLEDSLKFVLK